MLEHDSRVKSIVVRAGLAKLNKNLLVNVLSEVAKEPGGLWLCFKHRVSKKHAKSTNLISHTTNYLNIAPEGPHSIRILTCQNVEYKFHLCA